MRRSMLHNGGEVGAGTGPSSSPRTYNPSLSVGSASRGRAYRAGLGMRSKLDTEPGRKRLGGGSHADDPVDSVAAQ